MRSETIHMAAMIGLWSSLAAIGFATLSPIGLRPQLAGLQTEHLLAFGAVGFLAALAYPRRVLPVLAFIVGAAALLELAQHLVPGRHGRLLDFTMKTIGGIAGFAIATVATAGLRLANRSRAT